MPKPFSPIDAAGLDALATGSLRAFANLVTDPDLAARLREQQLGKPTYVHTMVRARTDVLLLRSELGETREEVLTDMVKHLHYGDRPIEVATKIVQGILSAAMLKQAADVASWIRSSPHHKSARLLRLKEGLAYLASRRMDAASTILDVDAADAAD